MLLHPKIDDSRKSSQHRFQIAPLKVIGAKSFNRALGWVELFMITDSRRNMSLLVTSFRLTDL